MLGGKNNQCPLHTKALCLTNTYIAQPLSLTHLLFFFFVNLFICLFFWLHWVFVAARGRVGATLRCGARASHCSGFSCCGAQALGAQVSVVVACGLRSCGLQALDLRLSSCSAQT